MAAFEFTVGAFVQPSRLLTRESVFGFDSFLGKKTKLRHDRVVNSLKGKQMEDEIFFQRYKVCRGFDGEPEEIGRTGAAITYKAIDQQSQQAVVLQLVPLA